MTSIKDSIKAVNKFSYVLQITEFCYATVKMIHQRLFYDRIIDLYANNGDRFKWLAF